MAEGTITGIVGRGKEGKRGDENWRNADDESFLSKLQNHHFGCENTLCANTQLLLSLLRSGAKEQPPFPD